MLQTVLIRIESKDDLQMVKWEKLEYSQRNQLKGE
jgi:hypothetical protein